MSRYRKLTTICCAAALALGLAACGSSDSGNLTPPPVTPPPVTPKPPTPAALDLPTKHGLEPKEDGETFTVAAGETDKYGNTNFSCPAGGADCEVTVTSTLGVVTATYTGGMVTAELPSREHTQNQAVELAGKLVTPSTPKKITEFGKAVGHLNVAHGENPSIKTATGKPAFAKADAPPAIESWKGSAIERMNADESVDRVVVYENATASKGTTFEKKYGVHAGASNNIATGEPAWKWDLVVAAGRIPAAHPKGVTLPSEVITITSGTSFPGTFDKVEGTFECSGDDDCGISRGEKQTALTGEDMILTFTASDASAPVAGDDAHHIAFGWWLKAPVAGGKIDTFSPYALASSNAVAVSTLNTISGGAIYSGAAAGRYVKRDVGATDALTGVFTADAKLTAQFGEGANVSGIVSRFEDADGTSLGFNVKLKKIDLATTGTNFSGVAELTVRGSRPLPLTTGTGDDGPPSGNWDVSFHEQTDSQQPQAVTGTFGAGAGDLTKPTASDQGYAAVGGAFGATQ